MVRKIALAYRDAYAGLSTEVWVISIALLINRCGSMVAAFLTLYLTQRLGFTMLESGAIFSVYGCLLYTSPSPRDATLSRMPSSA